MNYIKNELRSNLTATNLNAAIAITRTVQEFSFEKVALTYHCNVMTCIIIIFVSSANYLFNQIYLEFPPLKSLCVEGEPGYEAKHFVVM
jgi:hypothetical protein